MRTSHLRRLFSLLSLLLFPTRGAAQRDPSKAPGLFLGYEISEMVMNDFRHFAGEAGYRFGDRRQLRLTVMEVAVTERDLAGWWSAAVSGKGVAGYLRVYELSADQFFKGSWYAGVNVGYIANVFRHVTLPEEVRNQTATVGVAIGYARSNLFGVRPLHVNLTMPARYYLHGIPETRLGDATVRAHTIVPNTWLFIGVRF